MMNPRKTTIKDIARVAGVSTATVSQALRPREDSNIKLQEETIERVKSVAAKLNYRPHAGARSIRSNRFGNIGYFVAKEGLTTHTPDGYMAGAHDVADEKGFRLTLIRLSNNLEEVGLNIPSVFSENNLDGLIIESYSELAYQIREKIAESRLPVVYLNDRNSENSIYVNDCEGSRRLTEHLISRGHKNIAFIQRRIIGGATIEEMHHSALDRQAGYQDVMRSHGLIPEIKILERSAAVGTDQFITHDDWDTLKDYDALITYDDDLANQIGRYTYQNGIRIPGDIALGSFNGDYGSLCAWQQLTTIKIPSYEMGRRAAETAITLVSTSNSEGLPSEEFIPTLVVGASS